MLTIKSALKSIAIDIVAFCAVFVTSQFLSYYLDLSTLDKSLLSEQQLMYYDAQISMMKITSLVCGLVLSLFAVVLIFFSIERYIEENEQNMGILKALGYSKLEIASPFCKFGINVLVGSFLGYLLGVIFNPIFYHTMDLEKVLPTISWHFHIQTPLFYVIIPTIIAMLISFLIALLKLNKNALSMIKRSSKKHKKKYKLAKENKSFIVQLRHTIIKNNIFLIIFVGFSALCFGSTVQMAFSMKQANTSSLFFWMIFIIGLILGITVLFLSFRFVFKANSSYMRLLKSYGYYDKEITQALYGGYHIVAAIGFIIGTIYQFILMKVFMHLFDDVYNLSYHFDWSGFFITLGIFIICYETINYFYFIKIKKINLKNTIEY